MKLAKRDEQTYNQQRVPHALEEGDQGIFLLALRNASQGVRKTCRPLVPVV